MIAASAVVVSHSYPLALGGDATQPLEAFTGLTLGTMAVKAFFAISGFFILMSFERRKDNIDFIKARVFRIVPALFVVTFLTAFVVGPLLTVAESYFRDWHVWAYPVRAVTLWYWVDRLPGLFLSNPYPEKVNGALWSLFFEVSCYAILFTAGVVGLLKRRWWPLLYAAVFPFLPPLSAGVSLPFAIGMLAFQHRWLCNGLPATIFLVLALTFETNEALWGAAVAFLVLWLGFLRANLLERYNKLGDYSYGVYVYGFVLQQVIVSSLPGLTPVQLMALSLPAAIVCGAASWSFVEKPFMRLRKVGLTEAYDWWRQRLRLQPSSSS
jgi:peptidoglycan/LPS O-acetylase OafA/YrhL